MRGGCQHSNSLQIIKGYPKRNKYSDKIRLRLLLCPYSSQTALFRAFEVEGEERGEDLFVGHRSVPAIGGEDRLVQLAVREVEPRRALVVEIRQRALAE